MSKLIPPWQKEFEEMQRQKDGKRQRKRSKTTSNDTMQRHLVEFRNFPLPSSTKH